jgi:hypothetical protein
VAVAIPVLELFGDRNKDLVDVLSFVTKDISPIVRKRAHILVMS